MRKKVWVEEQLKPGVVDWPAVQARLREQGIVLVGGGADEAPEVYKRLPDVLAAHGGSIRVKHTLRPLGVAMAGRDVHAMRRIPTTRIETAIVTPASAARRTLRSTDREAADRRSLGSIETATSPR